MQVHANDLIRGASWPFGHHQRKESSNASNAINSNGIRDDLYNLYSFYFSYTPLN